ncbi:MAG: T9SS type A sorting domain-containing protein [Bacteroidia bacterium]|nr:MAG: T9SS type A sorting domain-containing protein [Bacteroidia bacterium]
MKREVTVKKIFKLLVLSLMLMQPAKGQVDFPVSSAFSYLKGSSAAGLSADWMKAGFDDSSWNRGQAPIRYGDGTGGTLLEDMQNNYTGVYMRSTFAASSIDLLDDLEILADYDDGFVVWINGSRVLSVNAPSVLSHDGLASDLHESGVAESFELDPDTYTLLEGLNTLAVQAFNYSLESTDFFLDISLYAGTLEPTLVDSEGLTFSVPAGFYEEAFELQITPADPSWKVFYTLDGSNPQDSETAMVSQGGATIQIDPSSNNGRPRTPAVVVRASAGIDGLKPAFPETRSYIFLEKVRTQSYPGGGWPTSSVNGQIIDLNMDPNIVNSSAYGGKINQSLIDIPSISVVTDLDNLFDWQTGIYVNAEGHGHAWERECSVELIPSDGSEGFSVNAGLRIRGGWSRHPDFPKHAFRLFFRSEYGDAKLHYPLFGEEGVDSFDKIDLRTAQNYAWSSGDSRNTFMRDVFSRDTQRDMNQPYTRSSFYHLYLNGMYWGLFQTQERAEARFAESYFGGAVEDYDVIKVNTENYNYTLEATDGNSDHWFEIYTMWFASNQEYFRLEGKDQFGHPVKGGQVHVDIDNLIDYMLVIFYTGNFDSPTASFMNNKRPNNFYAIDDRTDFSRGFQFYAHDAEHTMFDEVFSPAFGLLEDRVNLDKRTDGSHMDVSDFSAFHPQWLHYKLTFNEEYRIRFMDRASKHLAGDGSLTRSKLEGRLKVREEQIDKAIIAESARWGDAKSGTPYTRDDHWVPQVNKLRKDYFPYRGDIVINQLKTAGLYSALEAPVAFHNDTIVSNRTVHLDGPTTLRMENKNSSGFFIYTTNGTDPRKVGGGYSEEAFPYFGKELIFNLQSSVVIKARIKIGQEWSPLTELIAVVDEEDYSGLVVTELHYHPKESVYGEDSLYSKDLEFIEFKNIGVWAVNLAGLVLDSAVYYEFPDEAVLAPGQFYVVASKPSSFYREYGLVPSGNYQRNFSNSGEEVLLRHRDGQTIFLFSYSDSDPWPELPDGIGYSLVSASHVPSGAPSVAAYWRSSGEIGGSPFADDQYPTSDHPLDEEQEILLYPNPTSGMLHISWSEQETGSKAVFQLYGINGMLVYRKELHGSTSLDLGGLNLTPGMYIVRIRTDSKVHTKKIIFR